MRHPERSTIPSRNCSVNEKEKKPPKTFTFRGRTRCLVLFAEIMRRPREAAKRGFPSLRNKGEAESPTATRNGKRERGEKKGGEKKAWE